MGAIFKEGFSFSGYERDLFAMNLGDGRYLDLSGVSGIDSISDGRGALFADFDNDGDLDVFLTTAQREAHYLFRNNVGSRNGFLRVDLQGTSSGRDAFGAVVRVKTSTGLQTKLKAGGSGFLSQGDPRLLFGLGAAGRAEWIEVTWPGGAKQRLDGVAAGSAVRVVEGSAGHTLLAERRFRLTDPLSGEEALLAGLGIGKGRPFPDLALRAADGAELRLQNLQRPGRRVLVNLWATWCGPCAQEIPELQRLYRDLERAGIDLVGISVDLDTVEQVPAYLAALNVTYPVFTTDQQALEILFPRGEARVPLTLLLDDRGRVQQVFSGWSEASQAALRKLSGRTVG